MISFIFITLAIVSQKLCVGSSTAKDFYSYNVLDQDGNSISLERFRGKVSLVVNVASQCGYTASTYKEMARIHDILSYGQHFNVLAFPCNQFGEQEPGTMKEILDYVRNEFNAEFPIFQKIDVIGDNAAPSFAHLIEQSETVPDWNFYKYLVNGEGNVIQAWGSSTSIEDIFDEVQKAVIVAETAAKKGEQSAKSKDEL